MGTPWRGLLAPINKPTGDERRMKNGAVSYRELPLGLKWQRVDSAGHDDSVIIGSFDECLLATTVEAVAAEFISAELAAKRGLADDDMGAWGRGELFDDIDPAELPRLFEDVTEAKLLLDRMVIGPSVDAGAAEITVVVAGSDDPITEEELNRLYDSGEEPKLEELYTRYEIAAATLVAIPAFAECRPFELLGGPSVAEGEEPANEDEPAAEVAAVTAARRRALVAAAPAIPAEWFDDPQLAEVTPLTIGDDGRVYGHAAQWGTCHVGFPGICRTAPHSGMGYALFHRQLVDTTTGTLAVGRLTTGHGRAGTGCACCRGKDDHACDGFSLGQAIEHYDRLKTLAWLRAGEDEHGIWIAGALAAPLGEDDRRVLSRRSVSGDWRTVGDDFEFVEVLALAKEKPGFPLSVKLRDGRQRALVAAGAVSPERVLAGKAPAVVIDYERLGAVIVDQFTARGVVPDAAIVRLTRTVTAADGEHTGAMVALVPSQEDAARLAVDGGLPVEELHLTLMYLGESAQWNDVARNNIVSSIEQTAASFPVVGADVFAVDVFNPGDANDSETAIVLGVDGEMVADVYEDVRGRVGANLDIEVGKDTSRMLPDQRKPFVAHVTVAYSDDLSLVEQLTDRVGPVVFDRLRVAFGGDVVDIPLGGQPVGEDPAVPDEDVEDGASLADRGAQLAADLRAMDAAELAADLDGELRARDAADLCADLAVIG